MKSLAKSAHAGLHEKETSLEASSQRTKNCGRTKI